MIRKTHTAAALVVLSFAVAGCAEGERRAASLEPGERVVVHLSLTEEGDLEATSVDVESDQGDVECHQEGEHEGENEGCGVPGAGAGDEGQDMLVAPLSAVASDPIDVFGITVNVDHADVSATSGTYWLVGSYRGANSFDASVLKTSANPHLRIVGQVDRLRSAAGMLELSIFDRDIQVDPTMRLNQVESLDEAAEADINCEQEGEHEGNNQGC